MTRKVIIYVLLKGYWQNPLVSLGTFGCMTTTVFMSYLGTRLGHGGFACLGWTLDITGFTEWHMVCKFIVIYLSRGNTFNKDTNAWYFYGRVSLLSLTTRGQLYVGCPSGTPQFWVLQPDDSTQAVCASDLYFLGKVSGTLLSKAS